MTRLSNMLHVASLDLTNMKKQIFICIGAIILITASSMAQSRSGNTPTTATNSVGNIKNANVVEGCSCSLSRGKNSNKYVFLSDDEKKNAWMNIDGRDIKLNFVSTTQTKRRSRAERRGDRFTDKWEAPGITVRIDYVVTAPMTNDKEYVDYGTTITVTKNGKTQTSKATGNCGC